MLIARRRFLESASALPFALSEWRIAGIASLASDRPASCVLVDLGDRCALPESLAGFTRGLAAASIAFERMSGEEIRPADLILVPGGVLHSGDVAWSLRQLCAEGTTVLYETGAGYAESALFRTEQRLLKRYFGLAVHPPIQLWPQHAETGSLPYVQYRWPLSVMVRDFSRVVPVSGEGAREVARIGDTPVVCRRRIGRGQFIFCGSPIGPHLGAGDPQAQAWLNGLSAATPLCCAERLSLSGRRGE